MTPMSELIFYFEFIR